MTVAATATISRTAINSETVPIKSRTS